MIQLLGGGFFDEPQSFFGRWNWKNNWKKVERLRNNSKKRWKVIKSLKNRGILLKGTTKNIITRERGFLSFLRPLMRVGLPLIKNVLTPIAKSVLIPLGLSAWMSVEDAAIE